MEVDHYTLEKGSRRTRIVPRANDATAPASRSSASSVEIRMQQGRVLIGGHLVDVAEEHEGRLRALEPGKDRGEVGIGGDDDVVVFECVLDDGLVSGLRQAHVVHVDRLVTGFTQSLRNDR